MKTRLVWFATAYIVWCALTWPPDPQHLLVGLPVAALVAWLSAGLFVEQPVRRRGLMRLFYFLFHYLPVLLWECLKANVDVAYRVLHPKLPIHPGIVKVHTDLKSDLGITFLANSITLTPGTMSVDVDRESGALYIHWIHVEAQDVEAATNKIVKPFERILVKIFD